MTDDLLYRVLKWTAIALAAVTLGIMIYGYFAGMKPGDIPYIDGNSAFKGGSYERAADLYRQALAADPDHLPALRGLANASVQLGRYGDAMTAISRAIALDPAFGGHYAIRGIIHDHAGRHRLAMADYQTALTLEPEVAGGMHWIDRLLYNVQERPPTVADRLNYLKAQMALPEHERVLRIPEIDARQRPYEQ